MNEDQSWSFSLEFIYIYIYIYTYIYNIYYICMEWGYEDNPVHLLTNTNNWF